MNDVSSITRESALDIIHKNLGNLHETEKYLDMVIERAELDSNLSVRKRVIQILSQFLDLNVGGQGIK